MRQDEVDAGLIALVPHLEIRTRCNKEING